ncbi:MAG: DUF4367 domain-containing protein [Clostridia bacterium]|nr:DUF4367 domain-containing protein [Clostridia bacterium]
MDKNRALGKSRLEEAIREYECTRYDSFPVAEGEIMYSDAYLRRMRRLLLVPQARHRRGFGYRVAAILLAAVLIGGGAMGVSASRQSISAWITEIYERFTEFFFPGREIVASPDIIGTRMMPTSVPEGFLLCQKYFAQTETKVQWQSTRGDALFFLQTTRGAKTTVDHEESELTIFYEGGVKYAFVSKKGKQCFYWSDQSYAYSLIAPEYLSRDVCMAIIRSVGAVN